MTEEQLNPGSGSLLIVDDDKVLADQLGKSLGKRGFTTAICYSTEDAFRIINRAPPCFALVDLKIGLENGLELVQKLRKKAPGCRIVMLTAFGNIATAVSAIKSGAIDYLAKPADAESIERALLQSGENALPPPPEEPMTADRVRWEHIHRIYEQCGCNISETARKLRMHRRTLQRILRKYAPRDNIEE